jgi:hypothetical protein
MPADPAHELTAGSGRIEATAQDRTPRVAHTRLRHRHRQVRASQPPDDDICTTEVMLARVLDGDAAGSEIFAEPTPGLVDAHRRSDHEPLVPPATQPHQDLLLHGTSVTATRNRVPAYDRTNTAPTTNNDPHVRSTKTRNLEMSGHKG